jgi:phosphoglycolate phosphatase
VKYRCIVWDFDGTLADTFELAWQTYNALAVERGWRPIEDAHALRGLTARAFLKRQNISLLQLPVLVKHFLRAERQHMDSVRVFAGLPEVLHTLKGQGRKLGILSSNSRANILACLRANHLEEVFDFVVGYPRLFGKARALRRLLRREGGREEAWLYVGDEVRDVRAARKAGVDVAAVTWGFQEVGILEGHGPTYIVSEPGQIAARATTGEW